MFAHAQRWGAFAHTHTHVNEQPHVGLQLVSDGSLGNAYTYARATEQRFVVFAKHSICDSMNRGRRQVHDDAARAAARAGRALLSTVCSNLSPIHCLSSFYADTFDLGALPDGDAIVVPRASASSSCATPSLVGKMSQFPAAKLTDFELILRFMFFCSVRSFSGARVVVVRSNVVVVNLTVFLTLQSFFGRPTCVLFVRKPFDVDLRCVDCDDSVCFKILLRGCTLIVRLLSPLRQSKVMFESTHQSNR